MAHRQQERVRRARRGATTIAAALLALALGAALGACGATEEITVPLPPSATPSPYRTPSSPSPTPSLPSNLIRASSLTSDGDLISGWYWLRDAQHRQTAWWTFSTLPASGDLVLRLEALATDQVDGGPGVDAHFVLSYGRASTSSEGPLMMGQQNVTLPNVSAADDPVGYTCRGTLTIPRARFAGVTTLVVKVDRGGDLAPGAVHVAFNASSVAIERSGGQSGGGTQVHTAAFWSNGDPISGWYWLRDSRYEDAATWVIRGVPEGLSSLMLELSVLATNGVNGGPGYDARFYVSAGALQGETVMFGPPKLVKLPNTSAADDPVGYTCAGWTTIPLPEFGPTRTLVVEIRRDDASGAGPPVARHIAVNAGSVSPVFGE